jgi:hypothetical protein
MFYYTLSAGKFKVRYVRRRSPFSLFFLFCFPTDRSSSVGKHIYKRGHKGEREIAHQMIIFTIISLIYSLSILSTKKFHRFCKFFSGRQNAEIRGSRRPGGISRCCKRKFCARPPAELVARLIVAHEISYGNVPRYGVTTSGFICNYAT